MRNNFKIHSQLRWKDHPLCSSGIRFTEQCNCDKDWRLKITQLMQSLQGYMDMTADIPNSTFQSCPVNQEKASKQERKEIEQLIQLIAYSNSNLASIPQTASNQNAIHASFLAPPAPTAPNWAHSISPSMIYCIGNPVHPFSEIPAPCPCASTFPA